MPKPEIYTIKFNLAELSAVREAIEFSMKHPDQRENLGDDKCLAWAYERICKSIYDRATAELAAAATR